ncbi:uncharacterized protein LOC142331317 [Lycorma delicatula]|uniref:uncharacterized protein LOC142331317 n=1 Tax=Lycorma delicatula TaxID=130591 RepID=UPI003F51887C
MVFPVLKTGFCGCSLKTCSLLVAWLSLMFSMICLLAVSIAENQASDYFDKQDDGTAETAKLVTQTLLITVVVMLAILICFNIMLLVGIYKENSCLILPYICLKTSILLLAALGLVQNFVKGYFTSQNFGTLLFGVFEGILVYILFSYYREIKDRFSNGRIFNQPGINEGYDYSKKGGLA